MTMTSEGYRGAGDGMTAAVREAPAVAPDASEGMALRQVWRRADGKAYGVDLEAPDGNRFTVRLDRGWVNWADPDVWAFPERYQLARWFCPGHGGAACQYGACDEIRYTGDIPARWLV